MNEELDRTLVSEFVERLCAQAGERPEPRRDADFTDEQHLCCQVMQFLRMRDQAQRMAGSMSKQA
jgi:hypothetical protein